MSRGLCYGEYFIVEDVPVVFPFVEDNVLIEVEIDYYDDIIESNEGNNCPIRYVDVQEAPAPDLVPVAPYGGENIVVHRDQDVNGDETVYANEVAYIDFAVRNSGNAPTSGNFSAGVWIDGVYRGKLDCTQILDPGETHIFEDKTFSAPSTFTGNKLVEVRMDIYNQVDEGSGEGNNITNRTKYWAPAEITLSGYVKFWDLKYTTGDSIEYASEVLVEAFDKNSGDDVRLDSATTNAGGFFHMDAFPNIDSEDGTGVDLYFIVTAENSAARVVSEYSDTPLDWESPHESDHLCGVFSKDLLIDEFDSEVFYMANTVLRSAEKWREFESSGLPQIPVVYCMSCITSYYNHTEQRIYIETGFTNPNEADQFDESVMFHEYGHYIAYNHGFFEVYTGAGGWSDDGGDLSSVACQAWAEYWAALVTGHNIIERWYVDNNDNWNKYYIYDLENGERLYRYAETGVTIFLGSVNNLGIDCLGAAAGILWDITDPQDDDYTCYGCPPDGIMDRLTMAEATVVNFLTSTDPKPQDLSQFYANWANDPYLAAFEPQLDEIYDEHGCQDPVRVEEIVAESALPTSFSLSQNYPNPFNPATCIHFALPTRSHARIDVYNILGRRVVTLADEELSAGYYRVNWNGADQGGEQVASGLYFYRLTAGDFSSVKKMMLLK